MQNLNILILFPSLMDKGGVTSFCKMLMDNLSSNYKAEHLIIGNRPGNRSFLKQLQYFLKDLINIKKKIRQISYDVIHLNPSLKILSLLRDSFYMTLIRWREFKQILVMFHGWDHKLAQKIIKNPIYKAVFKNTYKHSRLILVLCNQFKESLIKMGIPRQRIRVITTMYQFDQPPSVGRDNFKMADLNILFMSRLVKTKGVDIAVSVGKMLVDDGYNNFKLIIAGDGPELIRTQNFIKGNNLGDYVETVGYVSGDEKFKIMQDCDIFLFPTHYGEGCPVVIIEAMGAEAAIISTPVAAIPEIVKHNVNGCIVDSRDPEDFFCSVKKLMDNKELLQKMCKINRKKAESHYEAKVVTGKIESFYRAISYNKEIPDQENL